MDGRTEGQIDGRTNGPRSFYFFKFGERLKNTKILAHKLYSTNDILYVMSIIFDRLINGC